MLLAGKGGTADTGYINACVELIFNKVCSLKLAEELK